MSLFKDSSLLGTFPLPLLDTSQVDPINMIAFVGSSSCAYDPWVIPDPSEVDSFGATIPLSSAELSYFVIQLASTNPDLGLP